MAATDPIAYLRATAPFRALPPALFDAAARSVDVAFHPGGTWLARAGHRPFEHLHVIRKGVVRLERAPDREAATVCREIGVSMARAETVNDDPLFLDMMADVVLATVRRYVGSPLPIVSARS